MKLNPLGPNQNEVILPNGVTILFSYQTPVAAQVPGLGFFVTEKKWSNTTTRHVKAWLVRHGASQAEKVAQSRLDTFAAQGGEGHTSTRENPRRNPSKFADSIEEMVYALPDQEMGSSDYLGWYGMVSGWTWADAEENGALEQDRASYDWPLNAIIHENSDGFIRMETFKDNRDMVRDWRGLEEEFARYDDGGSDE